MMNISITENDPIYSYITDPAAIKGLLSFKKEFWHKMGYSKKRKTYTHSMIDKHSGKFLTGFLPKVCKFLDNKNISHSIDRIDYEGHRPSPTLEGIQFREDQIKQIRAALNAKRGVVVAPTGTGKTVIMAGLISCFNKRKILFLCHTIDLVDQALTEFRKYGFNCSKMGGGSKDMSGAVVVSTIQTFSKLSPTDYCDKFDAVFTDECHHQGTVGSAYFKVLTNLLAPNRFAFTATLPVKEEVKMCLEGLVGPVLDEFTFDEAMKKGILAVPEVRLIPVDAFADYEIRTYADVYDSAIVNNRERNRLIIKQIKSLNREGLTTLTYVQKIEHIRNLLAMAEEMDVSLIDVQGKVDSETRLDIKHKLERKEIQNVVSTVVWREGINVKSLNSIIIAGGGKNEKDLIQACGRGARKDEGKDEFVIVDFVDSAKYLSQHFCERLKTYIKKGWL
jgi:superfamily II DNA or RNA helicase